MSKQTKQDQLCQALLAKGEREVQGKTRKYRVFTRTPSNPKYTGEPVFWFVGKMGAVRTGTCISKSYSFPERAKVRLLEEYAQICDSYNMTEGGVA